MGPDPNLITGRLNVNDYLEARKDDIQKLEHLLGNSGAHAKKRAFQSLPRTERRRAASHDPRRVPRKRGLRKKAEFEAIRDNSLKPREHKRKPERLPTVKYTDLSTVGEKSSFPKTDTPGLRYGHRQKDKVWLPTHVWHKKRAHMTNMANIVIADTASQKQFRRTYRLTSHIDERGAMAWDSSYYATFLVRALPSLTDWDKLNSLFPGSVQPLYRSGAKFWQGVCAAGGPATVYWYSMNSVCIQCNPLLFDELWDALLQSAAFELEDCRYAIGNIDIIGPQKFDIVTKILKPTKSMDTESSRIWSSVAESKLGPTRLVLKAVAQDPRVAPKKTKDELMLDNTNDLYAKSFRQTSLDQLRPQSEIDKQQGSNTVPFIPLTIYLLDDGRVRLSMPRPWVLPFWLTIFKKRSVLIGGQLELNQIALETAKPFFPNDFSHLDCTTEYLRSRSRNLVGSKAARKPHTPPPVFVPKGSPSEVLHVSVKTVGKGVPTPGDSIVLNSSGDQSAIVSLTTGSFAYSQAKGVGIGTCLKSALEKNSNRITGQIVRKDANIDVLICVISHPGEVL